MSLSHKKDCYCDRQQDSAPFNRTNDILICRKLENKTVIRCEASFCFHRLNISQEMLLTPSISPFPLARSIFFPARLSISLLTPFISPFPSCRIAPLPSTFHAGEVFAENKLILDYDNPLENAVHAWMADLNARVTGTVPTYSMQGRRPGNSTLLHRNSMHLYP